MGGNHHFVGVGFALVTSAQCRIKVGAIDAAALGPFKKWARGHGREDEKSLLYILVVISLVGTISGKSLKLLRLDVILF